MKLTFKKLSEKAVIPSRATAGSAGMDICACLDEPVTLAPNEIKMIPTGLTAESDCNDVAMLIYPRSGLSTKHGVSLANCVGVVDSDYRGEWFIPLINHGSREFTGVLASYDKDMIELSVDEERSISVKRSDIAKANLSIDF